MSHETHLERGVAVDGRAGAKVLRQEHAWPIQGAERHSRTREKGREVQGMKSKRKQGRQIGQGLVRY